LFLLKHATDFQKKMYMTEKFHCKLCFLLRQVFHKNNTTQGLCINRVCHMIQDVEAAEFLVQKMSSASVLNAIDRVYVGKCAKAFTLYKCCAHIGGIVQKYRNFTKTLYRQVHMNELVVQNLSLKIHIRYDIPYSYVQHYIWAKVLADVEHDISLESVSGDCVYWTNRTENTVMDMLIDMELQEEKRILELPIAPIFSAYEILQLQNCVLRLHYMCLQLPEDISRKVCSRGIYANYEIFPKVHEHYTIDADVGILRCVCAQRVVEKALECGGILIDIQSAFWIHCHLPLDFRKWQLDFVKNYKCALYVGLVRDLLLFPEIDQQIIKKIAATMMHTNW